MRDQFANWSWQSASPVPLAPLPKGGWHGEAVTGGYISAPHSLCPKMPPAAPFLSPAKEREERMPPKPMVLDSLRGHGTGSIGAPSAPRMKQHKSVPFFRIVSDSIHRDALRACAARPNRAALCVYRAARCGHRTLRNLNTIRCVGAGFYPARPCQVIRIFVGADASVRPPMLYRTSCKRCHCETSSQTGRGNPHPPSPRPLA